MAEIPDVYANQFELQVNSWDVGMRFGLLPVRPIVQGEELPIETNLRLRMSHIHAKAMAMLMRRTLMEWEADKGVISMPHDLVESLNLDEGDWPLG